MRMREGMDLQASTADPGGFVIPRLEELPPADLSDPVLDAYRKDVDRTLLREVLALTVDERLRKLQDFVAFLAGVRSSGRAAHPGQGSLR
jgi:asparagine synthetase B (glutamine-hydrolysing)